MFCDMHVHTGFSVDGKATMAQRCAEAVSIGLEAICFTDHLDFDRADPGFRFFDFDGYFDQIKRLQEQYQGRLLILAGCEFGEPCRFPKELEQAGRLPFDFILGSVHLWEAGYMPSECVARNYPAEAAFERYYQVVLESLRLGGFDGLAHLDYPRRYYDCSLYEEEVMAEIFRLMLEQGVTPELNTAGYYRAKYGAPNPGPELLSLYKQAGGQYLTLGSDSHRPGCLAGGIRQGQGLLDRVGLEQVIYIKRKMLTAKEFEKA